MCRISIASKMRGFEDIWAGWNMVIMDTLDEEYKHIDKNILPADTRKQIGERLVELHQANIVYWGSCSSTLTGQGSSVRRAILLTSMKRIYGGQKMCQTVY
ncbi:hypothetical protein CVT25_010083 [Psilocybe cyanescens]|uniref:Uncharacterized protein n=1 Tax=Psilocybe cyanescens TaxID=93625 RepID=A0A409XNV4_PSICY|nr:hypothetical protein CVT25_010083 [Psilocybe cyanescens]